MNEVFLGGVLLYNETMLDIKLLREEPEKVHPHTKGQVLKLMCETQLAVVVWG